MGWSHADGSYVTARPEGSFLERAMATIRTAQMTPEQVRAVLLESRARRMEQRPGYSYCDEPPRWGTFARMEPPEERVTGADWAFGCPMQCMWCSIRSTRGWNRTYSGSVEGGILLSGRPSAVMRNFRVLPLRPIWRGLLVNSLLFACLWFIALLGPPTIRRAIRRRRGCCPLCGYDLRAIASDRCPECGECTSRARRALPQRCKGCKG